jgi:hypothetical protein
LDHVGSTCVTFFELPLFNIITVEVINLFFGMLEIEGVILLFLYFEADLLLREWISQVK